MSTVKESTVESYLYRRLNESDIDCLKFLPFHKVGMPDRIVILPDGRVHWVELKTTNGTVTSIQKLRHNQLRDKGHSVSVLRTTEDVDSFVKQLQNKM